jgi:hypothetical protein
MRRVAIVLGALIGISAGCATRPPAAPRSAGPAPVAEPAPPARKTKLAVLPVEKLVQPRVAEALNERLARAQVSGVDETVPASISMEMALLQSDCAEGSDSCYGRIAQKLEADRLLWGEIEQARGKKKKAAPTTVRVLMFDVQRATVVGRAEHTFSGNVSNEALDDLLARATSEGVTPRPVQP